MRKGVIDTYLWFIIMLAVILFVLIATFNLVQKFRGGS